MGILNKIFKNKQQEKNEENQQKQTELVTWIPLISLHQLEEIKEASTQKPVAIFKHSTRCGVSSMAIKRFIKSFESFENIDAENTENNQKNTPQKNLKDFKVYYLDLISYREISNEIATQFQVTHQSPQLLIIQKKVVIAHASHNDIAQIDLRNF
ncbi:thioredoxin family protein [Tenacibaculum piscium]|uniref:thioredoxin family protein n=1 Tax=Tenacibaculum piscium TaxID=1458515 RepID=UPI001EFB4684|nr:thioredoxin family protein [Tenacibaculum piscium]MCG8184366.1 thioredoxin family protein [Tenacibaculum piscium]MCG8205759.1 thioredoxin family protein [Tenacibaculum piscium]